MMYYGLMMLVLACLMASVFVQGERMFSSVFFVIAYAVMAAVLIIGSKLEESEKVDNVIGMLLLFAVAFMSTETLVGFLTDTFTGLLTFKVAIIISLDYCAISFLRKANDIKHHRGEVIFYDREITPSGS
jgi:hypothetical protein